MTLTVHGHGLSWGRGEGKEVSRITAGLWAWEAGQVVDPRSETGHSRRTCLRRRVIVGTYDEDRLETSLPVHLNPMGPG